MNKGMAGYVLVFIVLLAAVGFWSSYDAITPTVARAKADVAIGVGPVEVIEQGASLLVKLILGAVFSGIAVAVYAEFRKFYKAWQRDSQMKRWAGGPNAQWKQQTPRMPGLKREDLMLMALMNGNMRQPRINQSLVNRRTASSDDDEIDMEF